MSSDSTKRVTIEAVEAFLIEHGLDPRRARAVQALLVPPLDPNRPIDVTTERRVELASVPTVALRGPSDNADATMVLHGATGPQPPAPAPVPPASPLPGTTAVARARAIAPTAPPLDAPAPKRPLVPGALLGAGGMGEVFRVHDDTLHRHLAMKVLSEELTQAPEVRARFLQEAEVTAQLAHPGIPPVHEIGELPSGRPYFTMKEVHGTTLGEVIEEVHRDPTGASRWSEQRLLEIFQKVCEAVAYAHSRGVAHCDLKPLNVMVGAFGEVLVMDWGAARLIPRTRVEASDEPAVVIAGRAVTEGLVAGTPAYMAPEHAAAELSRIGSRSDVYSLGVMLYELLAGERPYRGTRPELMALAQTGEVPPLPRRAGSSADDSMHAIIVRAMRPVPEDRYPTAKAMADELARWREGALRREKALAMVREAERMLAHESDDGTTVSVDHDLALAEELRGHAATQLARLGPEASAADKEPAWMLQDEADELARSAILRLLDAEQRLQAALAQAPDLVEAKALIARMRFGRCVDAEQRRAWDEVARHELVLRANDVGEFRDWLDGLAPLTLATEPPSRVRIHRIEVEARRLVARPERDLGMTPLSAVQLAAGSYLLELEAPGRPIVQYPVVLRRRGGWSGVRPGESTPHVISLPPADALGQGELWIGAGCCEVGGDSHAPGAYAASRAWVDSFVIREHPVTFAELVVFLTDPAGMPFSRGVFRDGLQIWRPDWPAVGLSWEAACAYAVWWAQRTGQPWRLPTELEWEKAARGVDGRFFPWGDFTDPALCHARTIERAPRAPVPITAFPSDSSPYGVRGMGGNVRDWCVASVDGGLAAPQGPQPDGNERIVRGGSFRQPPEAGRVAARTSLVADRGYPDVGFRLVRSF